MFNAEILKENIGYCYIFGGEIDTLSAIEYGYNAMGIGSTAILDRLFKDYEINKENVLIIAMDNDEGGRQAIPKAIELCKSHKVAIY